MQFERDTELPEKLQPAVFAANTQFKRSTSFAPSRRMFGSDCDPFGLLNLVTGSLEDMFENHVSDDGISVILDTFCCGIHFQGAFHCEIIIYRLITNQKNILTNFTNLLTMSKFNKLRITELLIGFLLDRTSNVSRRFRENL